MISVIIPTLNAAAHLPVTFLSLYQAVWDGAVSEVIVSDGGSADATGTIADEAGATIITSPSGLGQQLRSGASAARKPWLLFLRAEAALSDGWAAEAKAFIAGDSAQAAVFSFKVADKGLGPRLLEVYAAFRWRALGRPFGDQSLLISRKLYDATGGFSLKEDVDLVRRLGRKRVAVLKAAAIRHSKPFQP
jgi:glycosyltransferase involved in cell wall biosynthesis